MENVDIIGFSKDGRDKLPLGASVRKLDYSNKVTLTSVAEYLVPSDGVVFTDSNEVMVNRGELVRNTSGVETYFIPYRNVCNLPKEVTARDMRLNPDSEISVESAIDGVKSDLSQLPKFLLDGIPIRLVGQTIADSNYNVGYANLPLNINPKAVSIVRIEYPGIVSYTDNIDYNIDSGVLNIMHDSIKSHSNQVIIIHAILTY